VLVAMSFTTEKAARAPSREDAISARIVDIVRQLAVELHPRRRHTLRLDLDSDLDRDVGLDSLGRAELLLRLDREFKVRLPDSLIGDARCPRDLLAGVLAASPTVPPPAMEAISRVALPTVMEPATAATLIEVLAAHVKTYASRPHILLWRNDDAHTAITYGELDRNARAIAQGLLMRGVGRGDRVAIMLPTEAAFFFTFLGVLLAGAIPVPIYPPFRRAQVEDHLRRQAGILRNAQARLLVTDEDIRRVGGLLGGLVESLEQVVTAAELGRHGELASAMPAERDTVALIQYTSGSTGDPKGVVLSHANLLANIRAMGEAIEAGSNDVFVSWLPLYHDMGLIGAWLGCLYYGAPTAIMPPLAFLADPARWLRAIHRHRATLSAAPNFAFELCLKNVRDEDIAGLDLSTLRMVVNGADPVSPATITRFAERFGPFGFRAGAMAPVYGLAGCSVGLAFPPVGRTPSSIVSSAWHSPAMASRGRPCRVTRRPSNSSPAAGRCRATRSGSSTRAAASCPSATRGVCSSRGHRPPRGISATRRRRAACSTVRGWRAAISPTSPKGTCTSPAVPRT
jgi:acyl-CoA synthetase (AMP-forming)/AMP-acid ligase II/acyl carrier protein